MFTFALTALAVLLGTSNPDRNPMAAFQAEPYVDVLVGRCPLPAWNRCGYMNESARDRLRQVIGVHMRSTKPQCVAARTALLSWLEPGSQAWIFETHVADNAATRKWTLGQTAHVAGKPAGFGL